MVAKDTLLLCFGIAANCTSLSTALSPTPTFVRVVKNRSTEKFSSTPYIASVFSNAIWLLYGLVTPNSLFVITISSILVCIYGTYCLLFWKYAVSFEVRIATERLLFGAALAVAVSAAITWGAVPDNRRTLLLGLIGDVLSVIQVAAPLSVLGTVIQTKSAEYLPLPLCANNLINNTVWGVYALLKADAFVGAPCIPAVFFGFASVGLIFYYGDGSRGGKDSASGATPGREDIMYIGGGSMHGGVSIHRGGASHSQRGRPNKLDMGVPLLERIDSMPDSPPGTDAPGIFVISDEEEVHGARNFHTPTKTQAGEGTSVESLTGPLREGTLLESTLKREAQMAANQSQSGPRMPASFSASSSRPASRPASRRSSLAQQQAL